MADMYNGVSFVEGEGGFQEVDQVTTDSAYDCCVFAITNPDPAAVWVYEPGISGASNCYIGTNGNTCPNPASNPSTVITDPSGSLVVGNGFCGGFQKAIPAPPDDG